MKRVLRISVLLAVTASCRTTGWGPPPSAHGCVSDDAGVPRIARATTPDSALARRGERALEVFVDTTGISPGLHGHWRFAVVEIKGRRFVRSDSAGHLTLTDLPKGDVKLTIMRADSYEAKGRLALRTGYRDTVRITLGQAIVCATASR